MFTIILFRKEDIKFLEQYKFIFLTSKIKGKISLCFWDKVVSGDYENSLEEVIDELNILSRDHKEWKLVIYDGESKDGKIDDIMSVLIETFSRSFDYREDKVYDVQGDFPAQLLYIQDRERQYETLKTGANHHFKHAEDMFGPNFRMFTFEKESENGKKKNYNEFRLCCMILTLALGQIPYSYLAAGYVYVLDIEINWEFFVKYVMLLDGRLGRIRQKMAEEWENLKIRRKSVTGFPNPPKPKIEIGDINRNLLNDSEGARILTFREMKEDNNIELILNGNREYLHSQMFYPKGILHEECRKLQRRVEGLKRAENFLDEAGCELLEKKIHENMNEMCRKKDEQLKQQEFMDNILIGEQLINHQSVRMMKKRERRIVLTVLGIYELFILEPFILHYYTVNQGASSVQAAFACLLAALLSFVLIFSGYSAYLYIWHRKSWGFYKKNIFDRLSEYKKNKKIYLEEILNLLMDFRYLDGLRTEQKQILGQWTADRKTLGWHYLMLEKGMDNLNTFMQLLGEEEKREYMCKEILNIDFTMEPREEDYYRVPFQKETYDAELNYTGQTIETAFEFITRILIRKAVCSDEKVEKEES